MQADADANYQCHQGLHGPISPFSFSCSAPYSSQLTRGFDVNTGGDFINNDGTGVFSIYGNNGPFEDENFEVKHTRAGRRYFGYVVW